MALLNKAVTALMVILVMVAWLQLIHAAVYKVGDSAGWTTIGHVDYKQWAAGKTFQVGDVIHFEYHAQFHNVMRVTHAMYKTCNTTAPLATYTTGNDSITITSPGHHFFFCGVPGHCQAGQKVDINVLSNSEMAPTPLASVPAARVPGPSPNNAILSFKGNLALAMAVSATVLFNFA